MTNVVQVYDYRFPNADWPIMRFRVRVSDIAQSFGFEVENWEEDGLGPACGMALRLPSGRVVWFRELQHLIDRHQAMGPHVHIDAAVLAEFDAELLISEVLTSLGLSQQLVDWRASSEQRQYAIDFMKWVAANKRPKE